MAGLFGLFRKRNNGDKAPQNNRQNGQNGSQAYFLSPDDAKTFGNIDYMRTPKAVKRTYPGTATNGGEFEQLKVVSAMDMKSYSEVNGAADVTNQAASSNGAKPEVAKQTSDDASTRRQTDSSMDMFRTMAREIKKR